MFCVTLLSVLLAFVCVELWVLCCWGEIVGCLLVLGFLIVVLIVFCLWMRR